MKILHGSGSNCAKHCLSVYVTTLSKLFFSCLVNSTTHRLWRGEYWRCSILNLCKAGDQNDSGYLRLRYETKKEKKRHDSPQWVCAYGRESVCRPAVLIMEDRRLCFSHRNGRESGRKPSGRATIRARLCLFLCCFLPLFLCFHSLTISLSRVC